MNECMHREGTRFERPWSGFGTGLAGLGLWDGEGPPGDKSLEETSPGRGYEGDVWAPVRRVLVPEG